MSVPEHPPSPAELALRELWIAVHDYLLCQQKTNDEQGVAELTCATQALYERHNEVYYCWIEGIEPRLPELAGS